MTRKLAREVLFRIVVSSVDVLTTPFSTYAPGRLTVRMPEKVTTLPRMRVPSVQTIMPCDGRHEP